MGQMFNKFNKITWLMAMKGEADWGMQCGCGQVGSSNRVEAIANSSPSSPLGSRLQGWGGAFLVLVVFSMITCLSCIPLPGKKVERTPLAGELWLDDGDIARRWGLIEHARVQGKLEPLRDEYMAIWAGNPYDAMAHVMVGRTMEKSNDAFPLYQTALEMEPDNYWALVGLGEVYLEMGLVSRAVEVLDRAVELKPDRGQGYLALGLAHIADSRLDAALDSLHTAVKLEPGSFRARKSLGETLMAMGKQDAALEHLEAAAPFYPEDWNLHLVVATMQERDGEFEDALNSYKRVKDLKDVSIDAHMGVARLGLKLGLDDGVEDSLGKVLQMQPWNGEAKQILADIYVQDGNCRGAMRLLKDLIDVEPAHVGNRSAYANCLEKGGKVEEAMMEWLDIARIAPQAKEPLEALTRIVTGTGASMEPVSGKNLQQVFDRNLEAIAQCHAVYKEKIAPAGAAGAAGDVEGVGGGAVDDSPVAKKSTDTLAQSVERGQKHDGQSPEGKGKGMGMGMGEGMAGNLLLRVKVDNGGFASSVKVMEDTLGSSTVRLCAIWQVMNARYPQGSTLLVDFPVTFDESDKP